MPILTRREVLKSLAEWSVFQRALYSRQIDLMEKKLMSTHEVRNGRNVDTTAESIADARRKIEELDRMLTAYDALID